MLFEIRNKNLILLRVQSIWRVHHNFLSAFLLFSLQKHQHFISFWLHLTDNCNFLEVLNRLATAIID